MTKKSILIVEDDTFKADRIKGCLNSTRNEFHIQQVGSVQAAVSILGKTVFDFILLDMALPSHDLKPGGGSGASMLSGGIEVIMELSFLQRSERVVVITQYPEIEIEGKLLVIAKAKALLLEMFSAKIVAAILYRHESNDWELELMKALEL